MRGLNSLELMHMVALLSLSASRSAPSDMGGKPAKKAQTLDELCFSSRMILGFKVLF